MDLSNDPDLHHALARLARRRLDLVRALRNLVREPADLHRRLPGLDGAELIELAELVLLAGLPEHAARSLHRVVDALLEADEQAHQVRATRARLAAEARYAFRVRTTLDRLSAGDTHAWLSHLDRMSDDARAPPL